VSSANGTTGWADVTAFGTFNNGQGGIASMAYGVVNGAATVVAVGGASGAGAQLKYSIDEGANWSILSTWTSGAPADQFSPVVLIANGVLAVWCPNPATFKRTTTMVSPVDVTGPVPTPAQVAVGNNLFVCITAAGEVYTSPDLLTFTLRETPPGYPTLSTYLGYINGAHHFRAVVGSQSRVYATADFVSWYRVSMPQTVSTATGQLRASGAKFLATNSATGTVIVASFTHNTATDFPLPNLPGELPSYIKAS